MAAQSPINMSEHITPPFPPSSPDPEHESKISRRSSMSRAHDAIREVFFGNAKIKKSAVDGYIHTIQQRDETFHDTLLTPEDSPNTKDATNDYRRRSPSVEALEDSKINSNGFNDDKQYGWPGMGDLPSIKEKPQELRSVVPPHNYKRDGPKAQKDQASVDDSYGWAGIGSWSPRKET